MKRRSTGNCNVTRVVKDGTEPGIRIGRGRREAITTEDNVAGISMSYIKAKELEGPDWWGVREVKNEATVRHTHEK